MFFSVLLAKFINRNINSAGKLHGTQHTGFKNSFVQKYQKVLFCKAYRSYTSDGLHNKPAALLLCWMGF